MANITRVPVRATILIGGIYVKTPYIQSFRVSKVRNGKSTFQAALKMPENVLRTLTDNKVVIWAGIEGTENKIFTGYVLTATPQPSWADPSFVIYNVSGADILHELEREKFTRRQIDKKNKWCIINSVATNMSEKGSQFKLLNHNMVTTNGDVVTNQQRNDTNLVPVDLNSAASASHTANKPAVALNITNVSSDEEVA